MKYKIHFVGIGGIGISGLAKYLKSQGVSISGSDIAQSSSTKYLQEKGICVQIPHSKSCITDQDIIIHSAIIKQDNIEILEAKSKNIKVMSRKEALSFILKDKRVFSVCGAHGKSTTSAMLSSIFPHFGAIIGADSKEFGSNVREVNSQNIVFEADESDGSFLNSNPYCAIVTNTEPEHMENYGYDLDKFYGAYKSFLLKAKKRVINMDDPFLATLDDLDAIRLYPQRDIKNIEFFLKDDEPYTKFTLKDFGEFKVWGFGDHTALNASLAILASTDELEIERIRENLTKFRGIKKRFDILQKGKSTIIDDYAHHPTEIKASLQSIREYAKLKGINKIISIWQPHKYSRFLDNKEAFIECFAQSDELIILPVWRAGEEHIDIDFENFFKKYSPIFASKIKREDSKITLIQNDTPIKTLDNAIIVGFGAGDITYQLRGN